MFYGEKIKLALNAYDDVFRNIIFNDFSKGVKKRAKVIYKNGINLLHSGWYLPKLIPVDPFIYFQMNHFHAKRSLAQRKYSAIIFFPTAD